MTLNTTSVRARIARAVHRRRVLAVQVTLVRRHRHAPVLHAERLDVDVVAAAYVDNLLDNQAVGEQRVVDTDVLQCREETVSLEFSGKIYRT